MSEAIREANASSGSPSPDRASCVMGGVNKTFFVIDELNSMAYCVYSV
jgi:hypothetical protein